MIKKTEIISKFLTMKSIITITIFFISCNILIGQNSSDANMVEKACLNYIEGFYEGDTLKLKESLKPKLYKHGFWKEEGSETYRSAGSMSYEQALAYAKNVLEKKNFPKEDAPKQVKILDISNHIAAAKIVAWWGMDYILLSKENGVWMIDEVLWEGPFEKSHLD